MYIWSRVAPIVASIAILAIVVGAGCLGAQEGNTATSDLGDVSSGDGTADGSASDVVPDVLVDVDSADVDSAEVLSDVLADDLSTQDTQSSDSVLPDALEISPIIVDWAWQTTPSATGIQHREALSLVNGDVVIAFTFGGETVIEGTTLGTPASPAMDGIMRVTPDGDVRYAVAAA